MSFEETAYLKEYYVVTWIIQHDSVPAERFLKDGFKQHVSFQSCYCSHASKLREEVNMAENDSPLNQLTKEEHIEMFNKYYLFSEETKPEEIVRKIARMNRFIAIRKTAVQAMTKSLQDKKEKLTKSERAALAALDRKYKPEIRLDAKITVGNKEVDEFLATFPSAQRGAMSALVKQLGVEKARLLIADMKNKGEKK